MVQSIWEDVRRTFTHGNSVSRLVVVNAVVFVGINLVNILLFIINGAKPHPFFASLVEWLSLNREPWLIITRPWGIFSHMFLHTGFFHVLFNMLYLFWFGRIVADFIGDRRILPLYLMGGLAGAVIFVLSANTLPNIGLYALGASAAVMAVVTAAGAIAPEYTIRLMFIGDVKLKYIVFVMIFLDMLSIANSNNAGGHFAHLGGALFGWLYILQLQKGRDWTLPMSNLFEGLKRWWGNWSQGNKNSRQGPRVIYRKPKTSAQRSGTASRRPTGGAARSDNLGYQEQLDAILDKIKESGYESLSREEKEFLFNASKR